MALKKRGKTFRALAGNAAHLRKKCVCHVFEDAAEKYLLDRLPELDESSQQKERQLLVKPKEYFRGKRLRNIEAEDVIGFRQSRTAEGVGPAIINMEVGVIRRMLKRAKRWALWRRTSGRYANLAVLAGL